ncbi:MAG: protein kinase [Acidobacteria bacterium]|nr:protein kinase [Acidobacteriota bacterium]
MSATNWPAIKDAFEQCCPLSDTERQQCLAALPDPEVAGEVQSLLQFYPASAAFLSESAVEIFLRTSDPWIEKDIAGYRLTELIGEGGTARVYRAQRIDGQFRKIAAVKLLKAGIFGEDIHRRFLRERQLLADLDHPNIIRLLDGGVTPDGRPYIVMDFVDGVPITQYARDAALSPPDRLALIRQAANAIAYAHRKGVIHRDLKPGNILVNREGQVKLLDFGIAHLTANTQEDGIHTQTQTRLWTPAYASPEQARGARILPESDLYSLGIVIYELLQGVLPYSVKGLPQHEIVQVICSAKPHGPLSPVLTRLLSKTAASRGTAAQLEADLVHPGRFLSQTKSPSLRWFTACALIAATAFLAGLWMRSFPPSPLQFPEPTTIATNGFAPSISPDGAKVAYIAELGANVQRLAVKDLRTGQIQQFSEVTHARWSPDGKRLAALDLNGEAGTIITIDFPSGRQTEVARLRSRFTAVIWLFDVISWSPDGEEVITSETEAGSSVFSIQAFHLRKRTWRQLTHPPAGILGDTAAHFSPNGTLAFVRMLTPDNGDVYVREGAKERRVTTTRTISDGLAWLPTGEGFVYSARHNSAGAELWRVGYPNTSETDIAIDVGGHAVTPSFSNPFRTGGARFSFHTRVRDVNAWSGDLRAETSDRPVSKPGALGTDCCADLSPDGNFAAYSSNLTGKYEIWVTDLRTGVFHQITAMNGPYTDSPRWSPDGRQIAFTSAHGENRDIFLVSPEGGVAHRFTTEPSEEGRPAWSRDGRWLYFRSNRTGTNQIWRRRTDGSGITEQITRKGGYEAQESHDGRTLFYPRQRASNEIWAMPLPTGPERVVTQGLGLGFWGVGHDGVYMLEILGSSRNAVVKRVPFTGGPEEQIRAIHAPGEITGFRISWDGSKILWSQTDRNEDNVMVVDWPVKSH